MSQWGAPSPTKAGTKYTPPLSGTEAASCSDSAEVAITWRPSRSHWMAAPVMKMLPSRAYSAPRSAGLAAMVVSRPLCEATGRSPV